MYLKVLHGTRSGSAARLCDSCSSAVIVRGPADSEESIHCRSLNRAVRIRVVECNNYDDRSKPSLYDMGQIAWVLHTDSRRRKIGFVSAGEWRRQNPDENLVPNQ